MVLAAALGLVALFLVGFVSGAFVRGEQAFLPKPHIDLKPEPVFESQASPQGHDGEAEASLTPNAFVLTNTLLSSWVTTVVLVGLFFVATRKMRLVPTGVQNVVEAVVVGLYGFVESVAGKENARRFFPIVATIFLFVAMNAWLGLLPIYQSLGFLHEGKLERHLLRPAGTDLNMPLGLAIVSFVFVEFWGIRLLGWHYFGKFVRVGNLLRGRIFEGFIDLFVGLLELLSELVRLVSFTFRLFGNMTAGEILLLVTAFLIPFVFSLPFYGLELLVGFIQALIFAGLTLVFVTIAVTPHEGEEHD